MQDHRLGAIVRPLSNRAMQETMLSVRRAHGIEMISKHNAGRPSLKLLKQGGLLCILPDRHAGPMGALLPLFGRPTLFEAAPAHFALMSGAPIVPVFGVRRSPWLADGRIIGRIGPSFKIECVPRAEREAAILAGTARVIGAIEEAVRAHPEQWTWNLRRWRAGDATRAPQPIRVKTRPAPR